MSRHLIKEGGDSRTARAVIEPDEGKQVSGTMVLREVMGQLHRNGQLDLHFWVCQICRCPNHPSARLCMGFFGRDLRQVEDRDA